MANEKIKVAVIGCGTIANAAHIPSYMANDTCEIKYFCDIIPERADAAVEKYGCGKAIYDYHEILTTRKSRQFPSVPPTWLTRPSPSTSCAQARTSSAKSPLQEPMQKHLKCRRLSTKPVRF